MSRLYLKRQKNIDKKKIILIIIIIILLLSIIIVKKLNDRALPIFNKYSKLKTKKIISTIVNSSVTDYISQNIDRDKLLITTSDSSGNIKSIDFNAVEVNKILSETSKVVEKNLKQLEKNNKRNLNKDVTFELPSGIIFGNNIMSNILPKIPIKLELIGNIICYIDTDIKNYGINDALITVYINVLAEERILLPFSSTTTKVLTNIPIVMKLIEGDIPSYYMDGYLSNPSITRSVE